MVSQSEILVLLLCAGLMAMVFSFRSSLAQLPHYRVLLWSLMAFVAGSVFTAIEHLIWVELFNLLEHISFLINAILLAAWCFLVVEDANVRDADL